MINYKCVCTDCEKAEVEEAAQYAALTELDWVLYEFATIDYDYQIHPEASKRIQKLFERLYNAKNN